MNLVKNNIVVSKKEFNNIQPGQKMLVAKKNKKKIELHFFTNDMKTLQTIEIDNDESILDKIEKVEPEEIPKELAGWSIKHDSQSANENGIIFKTIIAYNKKPVIEWQNDGFFGIDIVKPVDGANRKYIDEFKRSMTDFMNTCESYKDRIKKIDIREMLMTFYEYKQHPYKNLINIHDFINKL